jgi:hypothetical protein
LTGAKLEEAGKNKINWSPQVRFDWCVPFIIAKKNSEYHSHETEGNKNQQKKVETVTTVFSLQKARLEPLEKQSNNTFSPNQPLLYLRGGKGQQTMGRRRLWTTLCHAKTRGCVICRVVIAVEKKTIPEGKFVV